MFIINWILDKFGFQPKIETFEVKKPVAKKVVKKTK